MQENGMNKYDIITALQTQLGDQILDVQRKSDQRIYIGITPQSLEKITRLMLDEFGARLQIATGVDNGDGFEILYHWALDMEGFVISFRVMLGYSAPEVNSIALICPAAEWIEREMWELLGINFTGHPDMRHLLLADDWPQGDYPMRKNRGAAT
jgi:Ni,Fe-hydrogenase III component G